MPNCGSFCRSTRDTIQSTCKFSAFFFCAFEMKRTKESYSSEYLLFYQQYEPNAHNRYDNKESFDPNFKYKPKAYSVKLNVWAECLYGWRGVKAFVMSPILNGNTIELRVKVKCNEEMALTPLVLGCLTLRLCASNKIDLKMSREGCFSLIVTQVLLLLYSVDRLSKDHNDRFKDSLLKFTPTKWISHFYRFPNCKFQIHWFDL